MPKTRAARLRSGSSQDSTSSSEGSPDPDYGDLLQQRLDKAYDDMDNMSKQYIFLMELQCKEKMKILCEKEMNLLTGNDPEFLNGVDLLEQAKNEREEKAEKRREIRIATSKLRFEAEDLGLRQTYEEEKRMLKDSIVSEVQKQITALQASFDEDFQTKARLKLARMPTASKNPGRKSKRMKSELKRDIKAKKSWPYVVYQLRETEVLEDLAITKQALARLSRQNKAKKKKTENGFRPVKIELVH